MSDLIRHRSPHSVTETVERLVAALQRRSITVFATIDHARGAREAGLELPDETVVVFGSPQAGTPLMQEEPLVGVDLPLRALVWDDNGTTAIGYHDPGELAATYGLLNTTQTLARMQALLAELVAEAAT